MVSARLLHAGTHRGRAAATLVLLVALAMSLVVAPRVARGDSRPANPGDPATPTTAAIDRLPTAQIDGVAWFQTIIGNTVYVAGKFAHARPAGAAAGVDQVDRNNLLAYDLTTGALTSFRADLNGQAYALAASPDGSRLYVGGEFTTAGGVARSRVVALDPSTGAVVSTFAPKADSTVRAIVATSSTVYLGGSFGSMNGTARAKLAAVRASDGALLTWAPDAEGGRVNALALSPSGDKVVVGGAFTTLNGSAKPGYGLGAVDPTTGASLTWKANDVVRDAGNDSAILSLASDGKNLYGTGYIYGKGGNLEGSFSASWSDGSIVWVEDCHGDSYGIYPSATAVYVAGHPHYCLNLGGYPEQSVPQRAIAFSKVATGHLTQDTRGYPSFTGQPSPTLQNYFPQLTTGTASGQSQAAWAVTGKGDYVVYAGEFLRVNGTDQQGLVRLAVSPVAPNKQGPKATGSAFQPTASSPAPGQVKLSWPANYDYDNANLTYAVYRDGATSVVSTSTQASTFWNRPTMSFTDTGVSVAQHTYRVTATDPFGNVATSPTVTVAADGSSAVIASDTFGRSVGSGFGSADTGGAWTVGSTSSAYAVGNGVGSMSITAAGKSTTAVLGSTSARSVDMSAGFRLDKIPNAGGGYLGLIGRKVGSDEYRLKIKINPDGSVVLYTIRVLAGTETTLQSTTLPGLAYAAGARLNTRLQVVGTAPTTIRAKAWLDGTSEPDSWQVSGTDTSSSLQATGSVGVHAYVSSSATNPGWVVRVDDLVAKPA